jgi:hypothetical protein
VDLALGRDVDDGVTKEHGGTGQPSVLGQPVFVAIRGL